MAFVVGLCALPMLGACDSGERDVPPRTVPQSPASLLMPTARDTHLATPLPLMARQWEDGDSQTPPSRLTWQRDRRAGRDRLSVEVTGPAQPWYASFMVHKALDERGVPREDSANQTVLACGDGISDPGCRITRIAPDRWRVETVDPAPAGYPYRVLYVQWPSGGPGQTEKWASWQLPTP